MIEIMRPPCVRNDRDLDIRYVLHCHELNGALSSA